MVGREAQYNIAFVCRCSVHIMQYTCRMAATEANNDGKQLEICIQENYRSQRGIINSMSRSSLHVKLVVFLARSPRDSYLEDLT